MKTVKVELTLEQSSILIAMLRRGNDQMEADIREIYNTPDHSVDRANLYGDIANNNEIIRVLTVGQGG